LTLIALKGSISSLASQLTARRGNVLGILGVGSGILASLLAVGFSPETLVQFVAVAGIGSLLGMSKSLHAKSYCVLTLAGAIIGRRITPTDLPQTVAALHSVVGLAAVLTSIGSVMADIAHVSTLHLVTAYLGVLIGEFNSSVY
jgi:NAD(P) transhydrogenase